MGRPEERGTFLKNGLLDAERHQSWFLSTRDSRLIDSLVAFWNCISTSIRRRACYINGHVDCENNVPFTEHWLAKAQETNILLRPHGMEDNHCAGRLQRIR